MMKYLVVALFAVLVHAQSEFEMKYFVELNNEFKGVLTVENSVDNAKVEYHNITGRDKIPFYAPSKEFTFTKLDASPTLATLNVQDFRKTMKYDLNSLGADAIDEAGISAEDIKNSVIIYNKDELPSDVTEKRIIHTIESLVLSIYNTKKVPQDAFYLYEPHKTMLMKVRFTKEGRESLDIEGRVCKVNTWVLGLEGRQKRLIRLYTNPYPVKLEAFSKKWSFTLKGVGQPSMLTLMKQDIAFAAFKTEVEKKYQKHDVKVLDQSVQKDVFDLKYKTKFSVKEELDDKEIEKSLPSYLKYSSKIVSNGNEDNSFFFEVSKKDVKSLMKDRYDLEDDKNYWKSSNMKTKMVNILKMVAAKEKCKADIKELELICKDKDGEEDRKDVDFEDHLEDYLAQAKELKGKEYKVSKVEENKKTKRVTYKLKTLTPISQEMRSRFVHKAFKKEYPKVNLSRAAYKSSKKGYEIGIKKDSVAQYACRKTIADLKGKYENGMCTAVATQVNNKKEADAIVTDYLHSAYPDIPVLNINVQDSTDRFTFMYLNDMKKVRNECR